RPRSRSARMPPRPRPCETSMASRLSPFFCLSGGWKSSPPSTGNAIRKGKGQEARRGYGADYRGAASRSAARFALHLLDGADAEQTEPGAQRSRGQVREAQTARPDALVGRGQHGAALVETVERRRELVEIVAKPMRLERLADVANDL